MWPGPHLLSQIMYNNLSQLPEKNTFFVNHYSENYGQGPCVAVFLWFFVLLLAQPSPGTVREGDWQGRCHPGAEFPSLVTCLLQSPRDSLGPGQSLCSRVLTRSG